MYRGAVITAVLSAATLMGCSDGDGTSDNTIPPATGSSSTESTGRSTTTTEAPSTTTTATDPEAALEAEVLAAWRVANEEGSTELSILRIQTLRLSLSYLDGEVLEVPVTRRQHMVEKDNIL